MCGYFFAKKASKVQIKTKTWTTKITFALLFFVSQTYAADIHEAARNGLLTRVQQLVSETPEIVDARDDNGNTPLMHAAMSGQLDITGFLINQHAQVNAYSKTLQTPLILAAQNDHEPIVRVLIENGALVNVSDNRGMTPLMWATARGNWSMINFLLQQGARANTRTNEGKTALMLAAAIGNLSMVTALIINGYADLRMNDDDGKSAYDTALANGHQNIAVYLDTVLLKIIQDGNTTLVGQLLGQGAKTSIYDVEGMPPLMLAAERGHPDIVRLFIARKDVDIDAQNGRGETALKLAVQRGHTDVVQILADHGADVDKQDAGGMNALMWAAANNYGDAAQILVTHTRKINAQDWHGRTALMIASTGCEPIARSLANDERIQINTVDKEGRTALMYAAQYGQLAIAQLLVIEGHALVYVHDRHKKTARDIALEYQHPEIAHYLDALLHVAAQRQNVTLAQQLFEQSMSERATAIVHTAIIDARNTEGKTPLMVATANKDPEMIGFLLSYGASLEARDHHEKTASDYTTDHGLTERFEQIRLDVKNERDGFSELWTVSGAAETETNMIENFFDAVRTGSLEKVRPLLKCYPGGLCNAYGVTALIIAATRGFLDIADLLMRAEPAVSRTKFVNARAHDGYTALMAAAEHGHLDIALLLIKNEANILDQDIYGRTAYSFACANGHQNIANALTTPAPAAGAAQ